MVYSNKQRLFEDLLSEGHEWTQVKHTASDNIYFTWQKFKKKFGISHNFTPEEIRKRNAERLKALVGKCNTKSELESLINQLEKWIAAAPKSVRDIRSTKDAENIKNMNQRVVADVTALNKQALTMAKNKLNKVKS